MAGLGPVGNAQRGHSSTCNLEHHQGYIILIRNPHLTIPKQQLLHTLLMEYRVPYANPPWLVFS